MIQRKIYLALDIGDGFGFDGIEQVLAPGCVDQQRLHLRVDVVYRNLELIEATSFGTSHVVRETLTEGEDISNGVTLTFNLSAQSWRSFARSISSAA